ncbi:MAG: NAD-dependent epimerase/dehydratase family protein [Candidatus Bathyarchaeota archaeon]|nr:NAD-dependent epimerase/dehydratase family protein [Candidatus Bathyarchaeota archaeon]
MRAIVTGGAGFIGSHLVDRLIIDGYDVTVLDNFSCGTMENLRQHEKNPKLRVVRGDIKDADVVYRSLKGQDVVFHLAAHANIRSSLNNHKADLDNNVIGTLNILEAMVKNNVVDLVFASTSAIYGEATVTPTPENYMPTQTSLYGASKLACEAYAEAFTEFAPIKFWAYRFANVIGERCRRGVVWDFVHKLTKNSAELEILGDGKQSKEYLYVDDCIEGINTGYHKSRGKVNLYNLAIEENIQVDEVTDIVLQELGLKLPHRRYSGGSRGWIGDNPVVHLSIDKIKALGWQPRFSAKEAIAITTRWTLENLKNP